MSTRKKTLKEKLLAVFLAVAVAVTMIPGGLIAVSQPADAASTGDKVTLTGKKYEYKDSHGDWHTNSQFSGSGFQGLCAGAHRDSYTGSHTYKLDSTKKYGKGDHLRELAWYCYKKGYLNSNTKAACRNRALISRAMNYVSQDPDTKDRGKVLNFTKKEITGVISDAAAYAKKHPIPKDEFEVYYLPTPSKKQPVVIWKYTQKGSVALIKKSTVTSYKKSFAGIEYTVYKSDKKTKVGVLKCKENGKTDPIYVMPGTYYAKETKTNKYYVLNTKWYSAKVSSGGSAKFNAQDKPVEEPQGYSTFRKISATTGYKESFEGIQYTVYQKDKKTKVTVLTLRADGYAKDKDGKILNLKLKEGDYFAKETKTNAYYKLNSSFHPISIKKGKTTKVVVSDPADGSFSLQKEFTPDSDDGWKLNGFNFVLVNQATKKKYPGTTDANGKITIKNLPCGKYSVTEELSTEQKLAGYDNEDTQGRIITIANGKTTSIKWKNSYTKSGGLKIVKTTDDGTKVSGFTFDVTGSIKGRHLSADSIRSYAKITQVSAPEGYQLGEFTVNTDDVKALNKAADEQFIGEKTVNITATATHAAPKSKPLEEYYDSETGSYAFKDGDAVTVANMDGREDEQVTLIAQTDGAYATDEINPQDNPECVFYDESRFKEYDPASDTVTITIPVKVDLKSIEEKDNIPDPTKGNGTSISQPEGWKFTYNNITWAGSAYAYSKKVTTGANGSVTIKHLPYGTYTVTEELTESQAKHFKKPEPQTKEITEDNRDALAVFTFENQSNSVPVKLVKSTTKEGDDISNVEFTLTGTRDYDGAKVGPIKAATDQEGHIDFGKLYPGKYVVEETGFDASRYIFRNEYRIEGHSKPAKEFTITGEETDAVVIEFENDPMTNLYITKVDTETRDFLSDAVFDLYEDGAKAYSFSLKMNADGNVYVDELWKSEDTYIFAKRPNVDDDGDEEDPALIDPETKDEGDIDDEDVTYEDEEPGEGGADADADDGEWADDSDGGRAYDFTVLKGLKRGSQYRLVETVAPRGYSADIDFSFEYSDDLQPLVLENAPPKIGTQAKDRDTEQKMSNPSGKVTIVDTVEYENLTPGKTYELSGRLVYKSDSEFIPEGAKSEEVQPFKEGDEVQTVIPVMDGDEPVTASRTFEAEGKSGTVDLEFTFDASVLANARVVAFERLSDPALEGESKVIAVHEDPSDDGQSIYFPGVGTTAIGEDTEMHITNADEDTTIIDTVEYSNVIAGRVYQISGTLMDKKTGEPILADGEPLTQSVTFRATENGPVLEGDAKFDTNPYENVEEDVIVSGVVDLRFTFDATEIAGTTAVAFEELTVEDKLIGEHKDINDRDQTVEIPKIGTKASKGTRVINDKVAYKNLLAGHKYVMRGVLMDKKTGKPLMIKGKKVTAERTFFATESEGIVNLKFRIVPKAVRGKTLVAFETCYILTSKDDTNTSDKVFQETEVASHRDLDDEAQTVKFSNSPQTGQDLPWYLIAAIAALLASAGYIIGRKCLAK